MLWELLLPTSGSWGIGTILSAIGAILSPLWLPVNVLICYLALPHLPFLP